MVNWTRAHLLSQLPKWRVLLLSLDCIAPSLSQYRENARGSLTRCLAKTLVAYEES
jgi:hypothetical protein